jgi:hypothetical protein
MGLAKQNLTATYSDDAHIKGIFRETNWSLRPAVAIEQGSMHFIFEL